MDLLSISFSHVWESVFRLRADGFVSVLTLFSLVLVSSSTKRARRRSSAR